MGNTSLLLVRKENMAWICGFFFLQAELRIFFLIIFLFLIFWLCWVFTFFVGFSSYGEWGPLSSCSVQVSRLRLLFLAEHGLGHVGSVTVLRLQSAGSADGRRHNCCPWHETFPDQGSELRLKAALAGILTYWATREALCYVLFHCNC